MYDQLMHAALYQEAISDAGARVRLILLPGIDHMGIVAEPLAVAAVLQSISAGD